jgi:environmental stress-induced protein Ves
MQELSLSAPPAAPRLIRLADVAAQAWRNGGGVTRELLTLPESRSTAGRPGDVAWRLRLSVAEVDADGPFSSFAGVTRWFAVLHGDGVELDIAGQHRQLTPGSEPIRFDGAAPTSCRLLSGATRDLNLMLRRDAAGVSTVGAGLFAARAGQCWRLAGPGPCGVYSAQAASCRYGQASDQVVDLPADSLAWFDRTPAELTLVASDAAAPLVACWIAAGAEPQA